MSFLGSIAGIFDKGHWEKLIKGGLVGLSVALVPRIAYNLGLDLNSDQQLQVQALVGGLIVKTSNWLKHTWPTVFSWL